MTSLDPSTAGNASGNGNGNDNQVGTFNNIVSGNGNGNGNNNGNNQQLQSQSSPANTSVSSTTTSRSNGKNRNIIASHYQIAQKIGEGSFGIIFKGYDLLRSNQPVAIKFESRKSEAPQLKDEFRAYKILNNAINNYYKNYEIEKNKYLSINGIPKVYFFGQEGYYNILIIQLLGPSLEDLFEWCGRKFSISTVCKLAIQMIERIQFLHENNLIYRDIKPDNFLIGSSSNDNTIYMVDYGMVKQYRDPINHNHIPYRERKSLSGTARYMSINTHLGREQSRRDDLESLGNVFVYFLKGQLPWQGLKAPTNKLKYEKIGEKKQKIPINELCNGLPIQISEYIRRVRLLKFDETPDYFGYIKLFASILEEIDLKNNIKSNFDYINDVELFDYDWMKLNDGQGWNWNKNKKINLNGYGSGVRHTTTQQTNMSNSNNNNNNNQSQSQAQVQAQQSSQQQQLYAQQLKNQQQQRSNSHSHSHTYSNNGYFMTHNQSSNSNNNNNNNNNQYNHYQQQQHRLSNASKNKTRAVSASHVNERSGLLNNNNNNSGSQYMYSQQGNSHQNYNNYNNDDYNDDIDEEFNNRKKSFFGWLCCCL